MADFGMDSEAQSYMYTALSSQTSIRIIQLLPAKDRSAPLQCRFIETGLETGPDYSALSYVWGSELSPSRILCDDKAYLSITQSLDAALRRFRKQDAETLLWADAICINQSDFDERSHQVRMMGDIYRNADRVLIWLGEEDQYEDTKAAVDCITLLQNTYFAKAFELYRKGQFPLGDSSILEREDLPDLENEKKANFDAFRDFCLKRPWFERAWTFQETRLARNKTYYCGQIEISEMSMKTVLVVLTNLLEVTHLDWYTFHLRPLFYSCFNQISDQQEHGIELPVLLELRRGAGCKNPSDLIYSLIGLTTEYWKSAIIPDYRKPFETAFAEMTAQLILRYGNLNALALVNVDSILSQDLPSWVPDWRIGEDKSFAFDSRKIDKSDGMQSSLYRASGSSEPDVQLSTDARYLTIRGIVLDTISLKSPDEMMVGKWDWVQGCLGNGTFPSTYTHTDETINDVLIRTVNTDYNSATETKFDSASFAQLKKAMHERRHTEISGVFEEQVRFLDHALILNPKVKGEVREPKIPGDIEDDDLPRTHADYNSRKDAFLVWTNRAILGVASLHARPGDLIVIPLGGSVPIVLRPSGNRFLFVSECYCHGFMDGQALVEKRREAEESWDGQDRAWLERLHEETVPFPTRKFVLA